MSRARGDGIAGMVGASAPFGCRAAPFKPT